MLLPSTRQKAHAFNQPLSFDTSSVTNMYMMFAVRSARALTPKPWVGPSVPRARRLRCPRPTPPASRPCTSPHIACSSLSTRQYASAFNQSLSFDTSKVADMRYMFQVRSARALAPKPWVGPSPCTPLAPPPPHALPPHGAQLAPHRMLLPSTRQGASAFNQPLSFDTSKVTNMWAMFIVRSARALAPKP
jgi:hypothetical protein